MAKAKRLQSGNWRIRVFVGRDDDGRPITKSITAPTKKEVEYLAASYLVKKKTSDQNISIGDAIDRYIESKENVLSPSTIESYWKIRRNYIPPIQNVRLDDVTQECIQKWVNKQALLVSPKTVSNAYGLLRAALAMHKPDLVLRARLPRKAKPLVRELPTSADVIRAVKGTSIELPVLLSLWLCLRMSEVRGIKKSSIRGNTLLIDNVKITISGKDVEKSLAKTDATRRIVKLPPILKQMILDQESEYATTLSQKALYSRFKRAMENAGFDGVRFHDIRHIAASDMNRLGITDRVAADRGGWSTTATMRSVYQHSFTQDRIDADQIVQDYYEKLLENAGEK